MERAEARRLIQSQIDYLTACLMSTAGLFRAEEEDYMHQKIEGLKRDLGAL